MRQSRDAGRTRGLPGTAVDSSDPVAGARAVDHRAWLHFQGTDGHRAARHAETALAAAGLQTWPLDGLAPTGPGLVFFDAVSDGLCDFLREARQDGRERVLAVATASTVLSTAACWRLLESGAADVFAWDHSAAAPEVVARLRRWAEVDRLVGSPVVRDLLVGDSPAWRSVLRQVVEVARFSRRLGAAHRRERHRQGAGRPAHPRPRPAPGQARPGRGRLHDGRPGRSRAASSSATSGARSPARSRARDGRLRAGRRRHAVPRRGRRAAARRCRPSCCASSRRAPTSGSGGNAWQRTRFRLVCATNRDLAARRRGAVPARPLLPHRRLALPPAAAARAARGHPAAGPALPRASSARRDAGARPTGARAACSSRDYPGNVRELRQLVARIAPPARRPGADHGRRRARRGASGGATGGGRLVGRRLSSSAIGTGAAPGRWAEGDQRIARDTRDPGGPAQRGRQPAARRRALGVTDRALQLRRRRRGQPGGCRPIRARPAPGRVTGRPRRSAAAGCRRGPAARAPAAGRARAPSPARRRGAATGRREPNSTLRGPARRTASTSRSKRRTPEVSVWTLGWRASMVDEGALGAPVVGEAAQVRDDEGDVGVLGGEQLDGATSPITS